MGTADRIVIDRDRTDSYSGGSRLKRNADCAGSADRDRVSAIIVYKELCRVVSSCLDTCDRKRCPARIVNGDALYGARCTNLLISKNKTIARQADPWRSHNGARHGTVRNGVAP